VEWGRGRQGVHAARTLTSASVAREGCRRDTPPEAGLTGDEFQIV